MQRIMKSHPYKTAVRCLGLALVAWGLNACSEMDDTYDGFLKEGEIIYVQGADSLVIRPGYKRVELSWLALSDPTVTKAMVYWNNGRDSVEVPINKTTGDRKRTRLHSSHKCATRMQTS